MFKNKYYCVVAGLPDLFFGENNKGVNSLEFKEELQNELSKPDFELVKLLYLENENKQLLSLAPEKSKSSDDQDPDPIEHLEYMRVFIEWTENLGAEKSMLQFENKLNSLYYAHLLSTHNSFLENWFRFQLNIKNILTAFNCSQHAYSLEKHLIKVSQDKTVYPQLLEKRLKQEYFKDELPFADKIFHTAELDTSPEEKEKAIDKICWDYLDEQTVFHYFTIEKVLSYIIKLDIIERWMRLDAETGIALLNKLMEELKLSYTFPEEFSTVK